MPSIDRHETLRAWASRYARLVLDRCQGNKREACRWLDISYHTLRTYLRYGTGEPAADSHSEVAVLDPAPNGTAVPVCTVTEPS
jgi:hypothetical protein